MSHNRGAVQPNDESGRTRSAERSISTAIIVAIVALVSTVIGATIGAATNYVIAARRDRADLERDNRNHAIEVKRAARLIDHELSRAQAAASICVEKRRWWSADVAPLSTDAWLKHSGIIAPGLSDQAWLAVTIAVEAVDHISKARDIAFAEPTVRGRGTVDCLVAEQIGPMLRDVKLGRGALAPFVFNSRPAGDST